MMTVRINNNLKISKLIKGKRKGNHGNPPTAVRINQILGSGSPSYNLTPADIFYLIFCSSNLAPLHFLCEALLDTLGSCLNSETPGKDILIECKSRFNVIGNQLPESWNSQPINYIGSFWSFG